MRKKVMLIFPVLAALIACYPLVFLLVGSLMNTRELQDGLGPVMSGGEGMVTWKLFPMYPTGRNYVELLLDSPAFFVMFWNSVKMTAGILAGQLLTGVPAAWGLAGFEFPGRRLIYRIYIVLMMMPFQVLMLSEYLTLNTVHLLDTQLGIILPMAFSTFPVFIMYRFFRGIPRAIIESARLDGAGVMQLFVRIGLPLGSGGIISAMVLGFLECWNLIEQPLTFLKNKELWPLSLFLPNIGMEQAGLAFAASTVTLIPAFLVFFFGQDYLEQGITAAAVKE